MVVDTSAFVALLLQEDDARSFAEALASPEPRFVSAATVLECEIVLSRHRGPAMVRAFDQLLAECGVHVAAVDDEHLRFARFAAHAFGRGRHPAALNYGDCFAYAASRALAEPLLFKGHDFARTDVIVWRPSAG